MSPRGRVFLILILGVGSCRQQATPPAAAPVAAPAPLAAPTNPVQAEMQLLSAALANAVWAIGQRDVRGIAKELHRVHGAKDATERALREGRYRPPKNPDNLARFTQLDEAFHHDLRALVKASKTNDVGGAAAALGTILKGCEGCHAEFRK